MDHNAALVAPFLTVATKHAKSRCLRAVLGLFSAGAMTSWPDLGDDIALPRFVLEMPNLGDNKQP